MGRFTIADGPMNRSKETGFAERQSAAAAAKKAALERHRVATNDPQLAERQVARQAVKLARDTRVAERRAARLAEEARLAAERAAEEAARQAALEAAKQAARDARYAARKAAKRKGR